jgi:cysteine desulfurase
LPGVLLNVWRVPYFDHNATMPLSPRAREAWLQAADEAWQNPSSPYRDAVRVRVRLEQAREQLAQLVGCAADRIVFNSGATEGANAVFAHWARTLPADRKVAVNPTEHPCVLEAARQHFPPEHLVGLDVDVDGVVRPEQLAALLTAGSVGAVAVMAANNETGVLQPWHEIAVLCRRRRVAYLCDASQWFGKLAASGSGEAGWIIATAHKFGGPKGAGFLVLPAQAEGFRSQRGGEQERGHRGGTENYPAVAAMVAALTEAESAKVLFETGRRRWRDAFVAQVRAALPGARVVGIGAERLWNTVSLLLPQGESHRWVAKLDKRGFQASTGSACATGKAGPSHVLAAMGLTADEARRVIRLSAGWETTEEDWRRLAAALTETDAELRTASTTDVIQG